jgi:hypothetical protein
MMEDMDLLYSQYVDYVNDEWEMGNIDELCDDGLTVMTKNTDEQISYRALTYDEFVESKLYERNNHYNG